LATDRLNLITGGTLSADVDRHAQALYYIDHAIARLSADEHAPS
jgi:hypothetical protein